MADPHGDVSCVGCLPCVLLKHNKVKNAARWTFENYFKNIRDRVRGDHFHVTILKPGLEDILHTYYTCIIM